MREDDERVDTADIQTSVAWNGCNQNGNLQELRVGSDERLVFGPDRCRSHDLNRASPVYRCDGRY